MAKLQLYSDSISTLEPSPEQKNRGNCSLEDFYEIKASIEWITQNNYKKIALQFPDILLHDSAEVVSLLKKPFTDVNFAILGDTSYGSECVDEVAAEHINADSIIHYGQATLAGNSRLPVLYIFGRGDIDLPDLVDQFCQQFKPEDEIVCFYDCRFHHVVEGFETAVQAKKNFPNLSVTKINKVGTIKTGRGLFEGCGTKSCCQSETTCEPREDEATEVSPPETSTEAPSPCAPSCCKAEPEAETLPALVPACETQTQETQVPSGPQNFNFCGWYLNTPLDMANKIIFYLGTESPVLTNLMMSHPLLPVFRYDPESKNLRKETFPVNRQLQKRFFMIEKAKSANIYGILIGTLVISQYMELIKYIKKIITDAGKKYYTVVVGKLNVAKLANFSEIDMFVLIAGPENSLIDSKDFYQPIITPFELEIALVPGKTWDNQYTTDFNVVLKNRLELGEEAFDEDKDTIFSLVSGKVIKNPKYQQEQTEEGRELVATGGALTEYSAAKLFLERSFHGLEQKIGETPVTKAIEGQFGIPMTGYQTEPNKQQ